MGTLVRESSNFVAQQNLLGGQIFVKICHTLSRMVTEAILAEGVWRDFPLGKPPNLWNKFVGWTNFVVKICRVGKFME